MRKRLFPIASVISIALLLGACQQQPAIQEKPLTSLSKEIKEIRPGILEGYLGHDEYPNSLELLPPPPEEGSAAFALDQEKAAFYVALKDEDRKEQAIRDNELTFPGAAEAFDMLPGVEVSEKRTPHLYMILRRSLADAILKRGKEFGVSRNVCNVHWHSDVVSGRTMGAAAVARLHANADFLIDLEAAKQEAVELSLN